MRLAAGAALCEGTALGFHHSGGGGHGPEETMALTAGGPGSWGVQVSQRDSYQAPERSPQGAAGQDPLWALLRVGMASRVCPISRVRAVWGPSSSNIPHPRPALGCQREGTCHSCTPRPSPGSGTACVPVVLPPQFWVQGRTQGSADPGLGPRPGCAAGSLVSTFFLCNQPPCGFSEAAGQPGPACSLRTLTGSY